MTLNVFTEPSEAFRSALEAPSLLLSIGIIFVTALFFSLLIFLVAGNFVPSVIMFVTFFVNWFVLSVVYWLFSFMFSGKKKNKVKSNFVGVLTAVSKLWLFFVLIGILILIATLGGIFLYIAGLLILVLFVLFFIDSFILMKTILDLNNGKVFLAWIIAIFLYGLMNSIALILTTFLIQLL